MFIRFNSKYILCTRNLITISTLKEFNRLTQVKLKLNQTYRFAWPTIFEHICLSILLNISAATLVADKWERHVCMRIVSTQQLAENNTRYWTRTFFYWVDKNAVNLEFLCNGIVISVFKLLSSKIIIFLYIYHCIFA